MNLRAWRKSEGLQTDEAATRLGIRPSTLAAYEKGARRPRAEVAKRIETVTGGAVSAASLLGLAEEMPSTWRGVREEAAAFESAPQPTIEIAISRDQAERLRAAGIDAVAIARVGAEKALKEAEARAWAEANREAIEASSAWIEKHGTFAEQLGLV